MKYLHQYKKHVSLLDEKNGSIFFHGVHL